MKKILVLGTSNSILKNGYVDGLKNSSNKIQVVNKSIGASPGIQFGCVLSMNFDEFDYVIFDSLPNDEQYSYETNGYSYSEIQHQILFEILSTISCKANLIIMAFVCKDNLVNKTNVYLKRKEIARILNVQFIDVPKILQSHLRIDSSTKLYGNHPAHPLISISYQIGLYLGRIVSFDKTLHKSINNVNYSENFETYHLKELQNAGKLIKLTNSLMSEEFMAIEDSVDIHFQHRGRLLGFYINAAETNCDLIILQKKQEIQLNLYYINAEDKLLKLFVPMDEYSEIIGISTRENKLCNTILQPRMTSSDKNNLKSTLQISTLLFWNGRLKLLNNNELENASISDFTDEIIFHIYRNRYDKQRVLDDKIPILKNKDGRVLFFNTLTNECIHVDEFECFSDNLAPLIIEITKDKYLRLFTLINKVNLVPLFFSKKGISRDCNDDAFNSNSELIKTNDGFYLIRTSGYYLCALPSGKVISNRIDAKNWEKFTISTISDDL